MGKRDDCFAKRLGFCEGGLSLLAGEIELGREAQYFAVVLGIGHSNTSSRHKRNVVRRNASR
jgi:hypothetical protein